MAYRQRRTSAALSAFYLALGFGGLSAVGFMLIRGVDFLEPLSLRQDLAIVGVIFVFWLLFWAIIAASRRRSG